MAIFRGTGGQGDSTTDTTVTTVTEKAAEAASSATSAANSATSASNSATSAETSATNAATSESTAATSATNASTSATAAETAKTAAQAAQTAAETAETNAETAEANAVTAKTQAESARDNAQTAQTAAETAETNAETAYSNTLAIFGDAQDVQDAVDSASASATTATTKASEAATSATNAANSATSAGTSETNAASSASSAATSAASANSYATDAQTAQTAAETAQAAAEAAEASINGLYLGSLADDPTLDGNGVAVTTGDLYFNTTAQEVRVYTDGDVWEPIQELSGDQTVNSLTSNNDVVVKGNLEVQGTTITVDSATAQTIDLGDNDRIRLGDSDDLQVYHDGTDSYIANSTGTLKLSGNTDVTGNITVSGTVDGRDVAADGTKLDGIEASADVTDTANVTAAGALMDSEVTNLAQVKAFDSADYATAAQGATADSALQSSGDTLTGDLSFGDNVKAKFGASDDLQIYHSGSNSIITDVGQGSLYIGGDNNVIIASGNLNTTKARFTLTDVELYYEGEQKLATTSSGVDVTGTLVSDGLTVDGSTNAITLQSPSQNVRYKITDGTVEGRLGIDGGVDVYSGSVSAHPYRLRSNDTKRVEIASNGDISFYEDTGTTAKLTWDASAESLNLKDNVDLLIGDSGDLRLFHNGTSSFVYGQGAGDLHLRGNSNVILSTNTGESMLTASVNGAVTLYYDNSQKLATTSTGIDVTGTVTADGLTVSKGSGDIATLEGTGTSSNVEANLVFNPVYDVNARIVSAREGSGLLSRLAFETGNDNTGSTTRRLNISSNGDISFYDDSGTSQDLYWDASTSRLGLGTTTPSTTVEIQPASGTDAFYTAQASGSTNVSGLRLNEASTSFGFDAVYNNGANAFQISRRNSSATPIETLRITRSDGDIVFYDDLGTSQSFYWDASTSRLGLGTTSPSAALHIINSGLRDQLRVSNTASDSTTKYGAFVGSHYNNSEEPITGMLLTSNVSSTGGSVSIGGGITSANAVNNIIFYTAANNTTLTGSEAARIDSSGHMIVGGTTAGASTASTFYSSGTAQHRRSGSSALVADRLDSDGTIAEFRKDGTTIGSIGTNGSDLYLGTGNTGISFFNSGSNIIPYNSDTASYRDAGVNLGYPTYRFDNLYLSGGVYLGGTGADNLLDDYEEGSFVPVFADAISGGNESSTGLVGRYVKIGMLVHVQIRGTNIDTTGMTSSNVVYVTGLPFTSNATSGLHAVSAFFGNNFTFSGSLVFKVLNNVSYGKFEQVSSGSISSDLTVAGISSGTADFKVSFNYRVSS
jgi:hypothetical protein